MDFKSLYNNQNPSDQKYCPACSSIIFITALLSLIFIAIIIIKVVLYLNKQKLKFTYTQKIIIQICLTDAIWSFFLIFGYLPGTNFILSESFCKFSGFTKVYFDLIQIFWIFQLVLSIYECIMKSQTIKANQKLLYHILFYNGLALFLSSIPFMTNSYDTKEEKNCFISYYNSAHQNTSYEYIWGTIERIILILTPTPCLIGFVFYVSYKVNEKLKGQMGNQEIYLKACITIEDKQNLKKHLYYFPITLMLLWSFLYMIRFLEICNAINDYDTTIYKVIFTISYVLCTLQGVANSLFFYQAVMENQISEQKQLKQQQEWYERDEGTISILKSSYVSSSIYESQNQQKQNSENHQNNRKQSQIDQLNTDSNY